jgi:hypothetical protein
MPHIIPGRSWLHGGYPSISKGTIVEYSKKQVRQLAETLNATNVNNISGYENLYPLTTIAVSYGTYGMNSGLFYKEATGKYYYVPTRSTALFYFV